MVVPHFWNEQRTNPTTLAKHSGKSGNKPVKMANCGSTHKESTRHEEDVCASEFSTGSTTAGTACPILEAH